MLPEGTTNIAVDATLTFLPAAGLKIRPDPSTSVTVIVLPVPVPIVAVSNVIVSPSSYPEPPALIAMEVISPPLTVTSNVAPVPIPLVVEITAV